MIEKIREKFIADTLQSLGDVEIGLSKYIDGKDNQVLIEKIFTVLHQIKGTAPMLGINGVSEMVAPVERVYTFLREGKFSFTHEIKLNTIQLVGAVKSELNLKPYINGEMEGTRNTICFFESLVL